jgi:hypothetical protein
MISLSNVTIPQYAAVGAVVGALAVYQKGAAVSGATFVLDDDQSNFEGSSRCPRFINI